MDWFNGAGEHIWSFSCTKILWICCCRRYCHWRTSHGKQWAMKWISSSPESRQWWQWRRWRDPDVMIWEALHALWHCRFFGCCWVDWLLLFSQIVQKCIKWCVKNSFPSDFNINFWHVVNHDKSIKNSSIFHILKGVGGKLAKFLRLKFRVNCIIMFLLVVHKESVKFFIWAGQKAMWIQNMF